MRMRKPIVMITIMIIIGEKEIIALKETWKDIKDIKAVTFQKSAEVSLKSF